MLSCFDFESVWIRCLKAPLKWSDRGFDSSNVYLYKHKFGDLWSFTFWSVWVSLKCFGLNLNICKILAKNFLNFCLYGTLGTFFTLGGVVVIVFQFSIKVGLFLEGPFKKGNNICMYMCSHFVFWNDWLMPEGWGIVQKLQWRKAVVEPVRVWHLYSELSF